MARYIDADWLLERAVPMGWSTPKWVSDIKIEDAPTADVRENVHAHWEEVDKYGNRRCSNCESVEHVPTLMGKPIVWNFCPTCGAVMDKRREND